MNIKYDYFQCGIFRVHGPTHIHKESVFEHRINRQMKIHNLMSILNNVSKLKTINGEYINTSIAKLINDKLLVIIIKDGTYDMFLDGNGKKTIDILPNELDMIIKDIDIIKTRISFVTKEAIIENNRQYLTKEYINEYFAKYDISFNPVKNTKYKEENFPGFGRE